MSSGSGSRRNFLRWTGAGILGSTLLPVRQAQQDGAQGGAAGEAARVYDVRAFGAKGDGATIDTPAINKAIEAAVAAGGGTVHFPAGTYACYSIHLKSNITLHVSQGATILAAETPAGGGAGYDAPEPNAWDMYQDFGHSHWHNSLIWGEGIESVAIVGPGRIWGKGLSRGGGGKPLPSGVGDKTISLKNCRNVTLRDISILQGGHFGILATGVDNFTIDSIKIDTNRDGMDIDCCQNVRVSNCTVNSPWDDGICPKSSFALGYARATKNLTITNCYVAGGYEMGTLLDGTFKRVLAERRPPRTGGIKCGSESNGGFQNITISNCVFESCHGLALETVDGALLEDIAITNITMRDIVTAPIFLRLGRRMRGPQGIPIGQLRRVNISNIVVSNAASRYGSFISGIPGHSVEDLKLSGIYVLHQGGGTKEDAAAEPPEKENGYPGPTMFGTIPAYGFYVRHVKGIEVCNVELNLMKEDPRPGFILDQVSGADFLHIKARRVAGVPTVVLKDVEDFNIYNSRPIPDKRFARVQQQKL